MYKKENQEDEVEQQVSKYSSGVNIIIRLDALWKDVNNHARTGKFSLWNLDLDRIWCELARDLKENYEDKKKTFDIFDTKMVTIGNFTDKEPEGFKDVSPEDIKKRSQHYKILMEKELFLRRLENELGKGTTFDDGDEDDFD